MGWRGGYGARGFGYRGAVGYGARGFGYRGYGAGVGYRGAVGFRGGMGRVGYGGIGRVGYGGMRPGSVHPMGGGGWRR